jgi:carbon-monoxide dehydrogenase medium subunit
MYPAEFAYQAPATLAEAVQLLQGGDGDVKLLAGGQSLLPLMKLRLAQPATLIDLGRIAELRGIREEGDALLVGATTTYREVLASPVVARRLPLLAEAVQQIGDMQVRARGTVGGSLAHADPAGDLPAVALALDAAMRARGPQGERTIPARDFFVEMLTTALRPGEVLTAVRLPTLEDPHTGAVYLKHRHPASGYAVVGVAAILRLGEDGACRQAQVAVTGAGGRAARAATVEQALAGKRPDEAVLAEAASHAAEGLDLLSDSYASADYRGHLTRVLARRALATALERARGAGR